MKSLIISNRNDFRLNSLIAVLEMVTQVGLIRKFSAQRVEEFAPDIILTDEPKKSPNSFDLSKLDSIRPFIDLAAYRPPKYDKKYVSGLSYFGEVLDFGTALLELSKFGVPVKQFFERGSGYSCYAGSISMKECYKVYHNAKVSPIPKNDIGYRELDIIVSGGNPLKFVDHDDFVEQALYGIKGKMFPKIMPAVEILSYHTNFDRLSFILRDLGYKILANKVMEKKRCLV